MPKLLSLTVTLEIVTGLALMAFPGLVISLLLGGDETAVGYALGRFLGIALLALGLACWPDELTKRGSSAFRAMLTYNVLVAALLAYMGAIEHLFGWLLWPAVVLHFALASALLVMSRSSLR